MDANTIYFLIAIAGCFVGLAGWLTGRDRKTSGDAEWRGGVNAKLDVIVGLRRDVEHLEREVSSHGERITAMEQSAKQAHYRIDRVEQKNREEQ